MEYQPPGLSKEAVEKYAREYIEHGIVYVCYHRDGGTVLSFEDVRLDNGANEPPGQ